MSLVFCGICSHAPGITGRSERADPALRDGLLCVALEICGTLFTPHGQMPLSSSRPSISPISS